MKYIECNNSVLNDTSPNFELSAHVILVFFKIRPFLYMTNHSPLFWGKVAMEKMAIINRFGPVFGRCI